MSRGRTRQKKTRRAAIAMNKRSIPILATFDLERVGLPGSDPQNSYIDFARTTNYTYTITTRVRAYILAIYMHISVILSTARHPTFLGAVSTA